MAPGASMRACRVMPESLPQETPLGKTGKQSPSYLHGNSSNSRGFERIRTFAGASPSFCPAMDFMIKKSYFEYMAKKSYFAFMTNKSYLAFMTSMYYLPAMANMP
jgi:hypothetical protein